MLAGASFWYEFYYDVWPRKYRYMWKIDELHKKYGPIVRINPIHIHVNDPNFLDQIYAPAGKEKRNNDPWFSMATESGMMAWSTLQTMDHHQHHLRRSALGRFFSKASVRQLESLISDKIDQLLQRLAQMHGTGNSVINATHVIAALTMDIISSYSLGVDMDNLSSDEWGRDWSETFPQLGTIRPWGRQFKSLTVMSLSIDPSIVRWFNPTAAAVAEKAKYPMEVIQAHVDRHEKHSAASKIKTNSRTIFMEILDSSLPPHEKSIERLNAEAFLLLGAGTDPTTRNLTVTMYHILANSEVLQRVREELKLVMPQPDCPVTVADLEALPFFSACITEGLRMTNAVSTRIPRISPDKAIVYKDWIIPKGSLYLLHMNDEIFPDSARFNPQRWLDNPSLKTRYLMAFGRGSRQCLGINLANAELFLTLARLLTRFDLDLYDVIRERDIDVSGDCFNGIVRDDSPGIRLKLVRDHLAEI
ncbi:hypothetical protein PENOC_064490 [Penicillium occitanis (nom. inval.)]|nr:hypothetical protein PENOC_064490 [Penicillium occitanis (nom. inval.)]